LGHIRSVPFSSGIISSIAGNVNGYDGDGNIPSLTDFNGGTGMLFSLTGSLLELDQLNYRLREITPTATTTKAGSFGPDGGPATQSVLIWPLNLAFDASGNYYIVETGGNRIRKVNAGTGQINVVAGSGTTGYSGDGGAATAAQLNFPQGVAADGSGNLYIADSANLVIRKVDSSGTITTFVTDATISDLTSLAIDRAGNLYSADDGACVIRKITPLGVVKVVAGNFTCGYNGDGQEATSAQLNGPYGVAVSSQGDIYISDTLNNRIRKVDKLGIISTIAGNGVGGFSGDGGLATVAMIWNPEALAVDSAGNVYIADEFNLRIRKISRSGKINTFAGTGNAGYNGENLPAVSTNLDDPVGIGIDNVGGIFVLDDVQSRVRKIH
jgi:sugar lactone lactonase YvrE